MRISSIDVKKYKPNLKTKYKIKRTLAGFQIFAMANELNNISLANTSKQNVKKKHIQVFGHL